MDPMANPYIAMAVLLEVGLHGIENKIEAPALSKKISTS